MATTQPIIGTICLVCVATIGDLVTYTDTEFLDDIENPNTIVANSIIYERIEAIKADVTNNQRAKDWLKPYILEAEASADGKTIAHMNNDELIMFKYYTDKPITIQGIESKNDLRDKLFEQWRDDLTLLIKKDDIRKIAIE